MEKPQRKSLVKTFYSDRAPRYDDEIRKHPVLSSIREEVVEEVHLKKGSRILDLGCGSGITAFAIRSRFSEGGIIGVDIADQMVRVAKKRAESTACSAEFLIGDIERIPFKDSTFDYVLCINVIRYLRSLNTVLSEIHRVLSCKGRVVIVDGDRGSKELNDNTLKEQILKKHPLERAFVNSDGWNMLYEKAEIRDGLMRARFENVSIKSERMYFIAWAEKRS